jgi:hypothetical protein
MERHHNPHHPYGCAAPQIDGGGSWEIKREGEQIGGSRGSGSRGATRSARRGGGGGGGGGPKERIPCGRWCRQARWPTRPRCRAPWAPRCCRSAWGACIRRSRRLLFSRSLHVGIWSAPATPSAPPPPPPPPPLAMPRRAPSQAKPREVAPLEEEGKAGEDWRSGELVARSERVRRAAIEREGGGGAVGGRPDRRGGRRICCLWLWLDRGGGVRMEGGAGMESIRQRGARVPPNFIPRKCDWSRRISDGRPQIVGPLGRTSLVSFLLYLIFSFSFSFYCIIVK